MKVCILNGVVLILLSMGISFIGINKIFTSAEQIKF